jgi:hypothetical protein
VTIAAIFPAIVAAIISPFVTTLLTGRTLPAAVGRRPHTLGGAIP